MINQIKAKFSKFPHEIFSNRNQKAKLIFKCLKMLFHRTYIKMLLFFQKNSK
jgi:hypothetical protein